MEELRSIGVQYMNQGDFSTGLKMFLEAEKAYPDDPQLQYLLGRTYKTKESNVLAIEHFKKAITLKPDYSEAKNELGTVYLEQEKWDAAIPYFTEAVNDLTYKMAYSPLFNLGWAYYNKKEYVLAEHYFKKSLKQSPELMIALRVKALRGLGLTYRALKRLNAAIDSFEKAIALAPNVARLHFDLAETYRQSGNTKTALSSYKKVITIAPGSQVAAEAKTMIDRLR